MKELTDYAVVAYQKTEELEDSVASIKHKVNMLEILYGTTPPPPDPNDTEDTPYIPAAGEIITTGDTCTVPVYYSTTATTTFPYLYFTAHPNSTIIIKLALDLIILSYPCTLLVEVFVDGNLLDSYTLLNPIEASYTIPFANAYISTEVGHKICYKITPETNYTCIFKVATAKYEILGNNIDLLNAPKKYSVHFADGIYYLSKCEQGYSHHLIRSISAMNINADYTQHQVGAVEQKFCRSYEKIDNVWQPTYIGFIYKLGNGITYLQNHEDPTKKITISSAYGIDYVPSLSTYYGCALTFANSTGGLYYYEVTPNFSSRITRLVESGVDYYVNASAVKNIFDNYNAYPQKSKIIATRLNGTNVLFSDVSNYYKLELGYGTNVHAFFSETGSDINVFMKVYNQMVQKVLTLNTSTNQYEIASETTIGTWHEYILGAPPAYFTVTNNILSYNVS